MSAPTWRAAAATDADRMATTTEQFVDQARRSGVRDALSVLRGAHRFDCFPAAERQAVVAGILATSVEKQARVSGIGRVTIPVGSVA